MGPKVLSVLYNLERKINALKVDIEAVRNSSDRAVSETEANKIETAKLINFLVNWTAFLEESLQKKSSIHGEITCAGRGGTPANQPEDHQSIQTIRATNHHKITGPQPFPLDFDLTADPSLASRYPDGIRVVLLGGWERYNLKDQAVGTIMELHTDNEGRICYAVVKYDDHPVPLTHRGWNLDRFVVRLVDDEGHPVTLEHHEIEPR